MEMTPHLMGMTVGFTIGLMDYILLTFMGRRLMKKAEQHQASQDEQTNVARLIKAAAIGSLILFPIIGYFVGPYIFEGALSNVGG